MTASAPQSARKRAFFRATEWQNASRGGVAPGRKPLRLHPEVPEQQVPVVWFVALPLPGADAPESEPLSPRAVALGMLVALALGGLTAALASLLGGGV